TGNNMNKKKDYRDDEPKNGERVQQSPADVAQHGLDVYQNCGAKALARRQAAQAPVREAVWGSRASTRTLVTRGPSISTTVQRRPSYSNNSPTAGIFCRRAKTN